jgi:hypothetical protein
MGLATLLVAVQLIHREEIRLIGRLAYEKCEAAAGNVDEVGNE